jgi:hypothetical protein
VVLLFSCASSLSGEFLDCRHYVHSLLLVDPKGGGGGGRGVVVA